MTALDHPSSDADRPELNRCAIRSSIESRLQRSGYAALSGIRCEFQRESGVLYLRGAVPSYYLKQIAQETARDLEGVLRVDNQIKVARAQPPEHNSGARTT